MCFADEVTAWLMTGGLPAQLGIVPPTSTWVAGDYGYYTGNGGSGMTSCEGWTTNLATNGAHMYQFSANAAYPSATTCETSRRILCCD